MKPLALRFTDKARKQIQASATWLLTISTDAAQRFSERLDEAIAALRQSIADDIATSENGRMGTRPDEEASLYFSRPVYRHTFMTGKARARRSSAGVWYLFYALTDEDGDSIIETLAIVAVQHSAAAPFSVGTDAEMPH